MISRHMPAPAALSDLLHERLAETGQALAQRDMPSFFVGSTDDNGRMVGGLKGEIAFTSAHISELWVDSSARGQGIGSVLLREAEAIARYHNCTRIHLETRTPRARTLYERHGYHVFGELPHYDGDIPLWYLTKPIGSHNAT